tara:strand:+ start:16469 stop:17239 length:771 start_codon:yes stop_codon:yes gene_type:complete
MSDLSVSLTAKKLGKSIEDASEVVIQQVNDAVQQLANAAYASMVAQVQGTKMDPKNRMDYLKGLQFDSIGNNSYVIHLEGEWANKLEDGFAGYDMKEQLLSSEKSVSAGPRAGQPWVRKNAKGEKYAAVPFEHKPYAASSGDMAADILTLMAKNRQGKDQKLSKTFTDDFGKPISGKVASVSGKALPEGMDPNLGGITKYQHVSEAGKVSSIYMTFRIVSEKSSGWFHPGWEGHKFFDQAEKDIEAQLENIVKLLL